MTKFSEISSQGFYREQESYLIFFRYFCLYFSVIHQYYLECPPDQIFQNFIAGFIPIAEVIRFKNLIEFMGEKMTQFRILHFTVK